MTMVSLSGILMIYFLLKKIVAMYYKRKYNMQYISYILTFGSIAFLTAVFFHLIGIRSVLNLIQENGGISPTLMAGGYKVMLICPIYGLIVFSISILAWGILKEINLKRHNE